MLDADFGETLWTFSKYLVINHKNYEKLENTEEKKLYKFWRNVFLGSVTKILKNLKNILLKILTNFTEMF